MAADRQGPMSAAGGRHRPTLREALIAGNSPVAVRATAKVIPEARRWPADEMWPRMHTALQGGLAAPDAAEGARAFVEKRAPRWTQ